MVEREVPAICPMMTQRTPGRASNTRGEGRRRVVLVSNDGRIERIFGPLPDREAGGSAHQILTWLQATR